MTEQVQHTHETRTDGINLSDGAASQGEGAAGAGGS